MLGFGAIGRYALGQLPQSLSYSMVADAGSFSLAGQDININVTFSLSETAFTLDGQAAGLNAAMAASTGQFILSGVQINFISTFRRPLYASGSSYWKGAN
jgi:hypothetical protein